MPRSGTTWLGKLFDSHPDTLYRHEPDSMRPLNMPLFPDRDDTPRYREVIERHLASMLAMRSPEVVGKQPLFAKSYLSASALSAYRASVILAKAASRFHRHFPCPYRPTAGHSNGTRLVWKSIESSGRLGLIVQALPTARAIHLMRHPCGYVSSVLRGTAKRRFSDQSTDDLWLLNMLLETAPAKKYPISPDSMKRLTLEERMAWRWVLIQEKILADVADNERVLTVRYEDICAEPINATRVMFRFAGLDWHLQTEKFVRASTHVSRTPYYSIFKDPQVSAQRWRSELSTQIIDSILRIVQASPLASYYADDIRAHVTTKVSVP